MGLNCTERTTNSIQVAVCKRNAFRPRYEHSVTRYSAAQNQFQTENQIAGLSIRSQTLSDFGLSLFGVVFCWSGFCVSQTNGSLSRAEFVFCFVLSGKWIAGRAPLAAPRFRIRRRVQFPDLGSVGFSGPRLGCVLIAVEKLPPCALVLIRRFRRLSSIHCKLPGVRSQSQGHTERKTPES